MINGINFEATGNLDEWPRNVPGKPTQAAVFGVYHPEKGRVCEILWTGQFPDLEPAMYWAAKKEVEAVKKLKWVMASRVLWQHEITPEEAVATIHKHMQPQMDRALDSVESGGEIDLGDGPMRPVNPEEAHGYYVEIERPPGAFGGLDQDPGDPLAGWWLKKGDDEDDDADRDPPPGSWIQNDPRR